MRLDKGISIMVRRTLVSNASVSVTRWNWVAPVPAPVLRRTPGGPHLPGEKERWKPEFDPVLRERWGNMEAREKERWKIPHVIVARAQYVPNETFLIRL